MPPETAYKRASGGFHPFSSYVKQEAEDALRMNLLFAPHVLEDVSHTKAEQKNGTDFFLRLLGEPESAGFIRLENKFEQYTSGNATFEFVSYDRPRLAPGWIFTSKAAWVLSWFRTGEICCWPMQELREFCINNAGSSMATTALNRTYLSWNKLERINSLLLALENARVLDLRHEIGQESTGKPNLVKGGARQKCCTVNEFLRLASTCARESTPYVPSDAELQSHMRQLAGLNLKRNDSKHQQFIEKLPAEWGIPV